MVNCLEYFAQGFTSLSWQQIIMMLIGILLIYLGIAKKYEPMLLIPIGFGAVLVNLPLEILWQHGNTDGILKILFETGILTELFPLLIFISVGTMIDFRPLLQRPWMLIFGIVAHGGIFIAGFVAWRFFGFSIPEAASIGVIGAADGPTSILVTTKFAPTLLGPITVVAYSYMSLVPIIMPPTIKLLTKKKERSLRVPTKDRTISQWKIIAFPILTTIIVSIIVPQASPLIGFLMLGNLIKESGVLEKITKSAQNEMANIVTLLLSLSVGASMRGNEFLHLQTLSIMLLGLIAFVGDIVCGVLFAKFLNLFRKKDNKLNPMLGACGISAFPMASRVVQKMALEEDNQNFLLMHAVAANVSGQIGSVIIAGIIMAFISV